MVFKKVVQFDDLGIYNGFHTDLEFTVFRRTDPNTPDTLLIFNHLTNKVEVEKDIPKPSDSMMRYHYADGRNSSD